MEGPPSVCVVLRTCARIHALSMRPRLAGIEKPELILRSMRSLCRSAAAVQWARGRMRLHVVDDASDPELVGKWKSEAAVHGVAFEWHSADSRTGRTSFDVAIDIAVASGCELIYFLEDDYIHYAESIPCILTGYSMLRMTAPNGEVALTPFDCPDRYTRSPYPTTIRHGAGRYWRTVRHTTGTFAVQRRTLDRYISLYRRFAAYGRDPSICEDTTINQVYQEVPCYAPIPTLAIHLQYDSTIPLLLPSAGWQALWDAQAR